MPMFVSHDLMVYCLQFIWFYCKTTCSKSGNHWRAWSRGNVISEGTWDNTRGGEGVMARRRAGEEGNTRGELFFFNRYVFLSILSKYCAYHSIWLGTVVVRYVFDSHYGQYHLKLCSVTAVESLFVHIVSIVVSEKNTLTDVM